MNDFGDRLKLVIDYYRMNKNSFSKFIGYDENTSITNYVNKKRIPNFAMLSKIILSCDSINAEWLIIGKGEMLKRSERSVELEVDFYKRESERLKIDNDRLLTIIENLTSDKKSAQPQECA